jgi:iron complex outermembrane receptor protein
MVTTKGIDWQGSTTVMAGAVARFGVSTSRNPMTGFIKEIYLRRWLRLELQGRPVHRSATANNPATTGLTMAGAATKDHPVQGQGLVRQLDFSKDFDGFFNELLVGARYARIGKASVECLHRSAAS